MVSSRQPKINIPLAKSTTLPSHQQGTMNNHSPQENSNDVFSPENEAGNAHVDLPVDTFNEGENILPLPHNKRVIEEAQNKQHQPSFRQTRSGRTIENTKEINQVWNNVKKD